MHQRGVFWLFAHQINALSGEFKHASAICIPTPWLFDKKCHFSGQGVNFSGSWSMRMSIEEQ
jgi:hypothetical protein